MNDRCAAGTGKFLEYTAQIFQIPVQEFGRYALDGDSPPVINSMCTVFAETEATSLMAQGVSPENIALGLHLSIARRTVNMLRRVGLTPPLIFVGGVAHNPCMRRLLAEQTGTVEGETLLIPDEPDMTGALGAALWGEATACIF
jgi:predicted CoA-substrate-specific enzyme activase